MQIHWLTITIHEPLDVARGFYDLWLSDTFGQPVPARGGMFYTASLAGALGVRLFMSPSNGGDYWSVVIPGSACECLSEGWFKSLFDASSMYEGFKITRLDLAYDDFPFSPVDMNNFENYDAIHSPSRKRGINQRRGEFIQGCDGNTWTMGTREGGRYLRVYDRRGCNRIEIELHADYASDVFNYMFVDHEYLTPDGFGRGVIEKFCRVVNGRVYDLRFKHWLFDRIIPDRKKMAKTVTLDRAKGWIEKQVAPTLVNVLMICGMDYVNQLIKNYQDEIILKPKKYQKYNFWYNPPPLIGGVQYENCYSG